MKKYYLLIPVLFIFLISCGQEEILSEYNFKQGVAELELRLLDNAPPDKIYQGSQFKLIIEADNQAAYDITQGRVWFSGIFENYFFIDPLERGLNEESLTGQLEGRSLTNPSGEKTFLEFEGQAAQLFENAEEFVGNFFLKADYHSTMDFVDTICINPNLYSVYDSGCTMQDRKSYSGQGAPIAVTSLEEIIVPNSHVEFRVSIKNRGRGEVKSIQLLRSSLGGQAITCAFQGAGENTLSLDLTEKKFDSKDVLLICQQPLTEQYSYTTAILLEFGYDYHVVQQHQLRLLR